MTRTNHIVCLLLAAAAFAVAVALYAQLPDPVPTHWNWRGVADGFTPKPWGAFILPLATLGTYLLLVAVPRISPRGFQMERFARVYGLIVTALVATLFAITVIALLAATGVPLPIQRATPMLVGALFVVLGNFMGKLTKNFFIGIRTPWTLASDEVWGRTHRLGGRLFVAGGFVAILSGLFTTSPTVFLTVILTAALIPAAYSYVLYRRLEGFQPPENGHAH